MIVPLPRQLLQLINEPGPPAQHTGSSYQETGLHTAPERRTRPPGRGVHEGLDGTHGRLGQVLDRIKAQSGGYGVDSSHVALAAT